MSTGTESQVKVLKFFRILPCDFIENDQYIFPWNHSLRLSFDWLPNPVTISLMVVRVDENTSAFHLNLTTPHFLCLQQVNIYMVCRPDALSRGRGHLQTRLDSDDNAPVLQHAIRYKQPSSPIIVRHLPLKPVFELGTHTVALLISLHPSKHIYDVPINAQQHLNHQPTFHDKGDVHNNDGSVSDTTTTVVAVSSPLVGADSDSMATHADWRSVSAIATPVSAAVPTAAGDQQPQQPVQQTYDRPIYRPSSTTPPPPPLPPARLQPPPIRGLGRGRPLVGFGAHNSNTMQPVIVPPISPHQQHCVQPIEAPWPTPPPTANDIVTTTATITTDIELGHHQQYSYPSQILDSGNTFGTATPVTPDYTGHDQIDPGAVQVHEQTLQQQQQPSLSLVHTWFAELSYPPIRQEQCQINNNGSVLPAYMATPRVAIECPDGMLYAHWQILEAHAAKPDIVWQVDALPKIYMSEPVEIVRHALRIIYLDEPDLLASYAPPTSCVPPSTPTLLRSLYSAASTLRLNELMQRCQMLIAMERNE